MFSSIEICLLISTLAALYLTIFFYVAYASERSFLRNYPKPKKFPSVSITIPVYNGANLIEQTLEAVRKLEYPRDFEIIVVDDGSTDETPQIVSKIASKDPRIKLFRKENGGRGNARNYGLRHAKGEIVVTMDVDARPEKDCLMKAIGFFEDKDVAAVTISCLVHEPKTFMQKLQAIEYALIPLMRKIIESFNAIYAVPGVFGLFRRDVVLSLGGFDEKNLTEDIEIAWRLLAHGYKIKMCPDARVWTYVPESFSKWWRQRIRWNIGGIQTTLKYVRLLFDRRFSSIGFFILPTFIIAYFFSIFGLVLVGAMAIDKLLSLIPLFSATAYGANIFDNLIIEIAVYPNVIILLSALSFILGVSWIWLSFHSLDVSMRMRKNVSTLLLFLTFYTALFPLNYMYSTLKFLGNKYKVHGG